MTSYREHRENFIAQVAALGMSASTARTILARANTAARLAVAQCNGDWPADNGERPAKACPNCETFWAPSTVKMHGCPDCRNEAAARAALPEGWRLVTQGDPRGWVFRLVPPGVEVSSSSDSGTIGVPDKVA